MKNNNFTYGWVSPGYSFFGGVAPPAALRINESVNCYLTINTYRRQTDTRFENISDANMPRVLRILATPIYKKI